MRLNSGDHYTEISIKTSGIYWTFLLFLRGGGDTDIQYGDHLQILKTSSHKPVFGTICLAGLYQLKRDLHHNYPSLIKQSLTGFKNQLV